MAVSTYNNTKRSALRCVLKRHSLLSVVAIICMLSLNLSIFEYNNNNYGFHCAKRNFKSLAETDLNGSTNLRYFLTVDEVKNEEDSSSEQLNKFDFKKYTAEEINEMVDKSDEFINRTDMHIIFSFVHDAEMEKFKKVEENVFKFIESIAETYKIPDEYKEKKFRRAHLDMQGYLIEKEKFLLQYSYLALNGKMCERKVFKEVLEYVKDEWAEFRKLMFELWKEKLASEFREYGEMLNQKRKIKQHELDRRAQREKMLEEHSRGIFAKGYLGDVESETVKKETEHHENEYEENVEKPKEQKIEVEEITEEEVKVDEPKDEITVEEVHFDEPKLQQQKVEPPKLKQQKVEPPKVQQQKVEPPKVQQQKVEPPKVQQQKLQNGKGQKQASPKAKGNDQQKSKKKKFF
ncbi:exported protein (PHISTc) [Plasmodium gaboni]|uniref:Exported protein (PHISTc) n=1 Tax=Plasmodium gaboni TaxID=647221 RepID=A0A151LM98_9APIC|nr:exported protein (PHISTc) [Plasmodium gaboni]KYO00343.1 exported protein (PHISTc) [Plasmodium gaboni]